MENQTERPLSESDIGAILRQGPDPRVAPDFTDRVMQRIANQGLKPGAAHQPVWHQPVWRRSAIAAAVLVLIASLLVHLVLLPAAPPGTRLVRFAIQLPQADRVALAGSFNGWRHRVALRARGHGLWSVHIPLRAGQYTYVFVVNGHRILADPHAEGYIPDGFGGTNSLIIVRPRTAPA